MDEKHFRKITFNESFEAVASAAFDKVRTICQFPTDKDYFREGITEGIINMEKYLTPESYKALTTASNDDDKRIIEVRNRLIEQMVDSFLEHFPPQQLFSKVDMFVSIANRLAFEEAQPISASGTLPEGSIADDPVSHPGYIDPRVWLKHEQQDPYRENL